MFHSNLPIDSNEINNLESKMTELEAKDVETR
jgi:hypothetical protein